MTSIFRQLKDVQVQADKFLESKSYDYDIESFVQYVNEIKSYLHENETNSEVLRLLSEMPKYDEELKTKAVVRRGLFSFLIGVTGILAQRENEKEEFNTYLYEIRSKFASIEFIMKNNS